VDSEGQRLMNRLRKTLILRACAVLPGPRT